MKNFLALLVFAGGFGGWFLHHQKQETSDSLAAARTQFAEYDKVASTRRAEYQSMKSAIAVKNKATEKQAELNGLKAKLKTLRDAQEAAARDRQQTVAAIRQTYVGKTVALRLTTGRDLGQVRIMKVDETGVAVATPSGVVKVAPHELPQEVKQALNF